MIKRISILVLLVAAVTAISAQDPVIKFDKKTHDFGTIQEDGGLVTYVFEFTNTGDVPLVIQKVRASCGCTTPKWTRTPVEKGKKGAITVSFNPRNRRGGFSKSISVYSNASNELEVLHIIGKILPKASEVAKQFPVVLGTIGLKSNKVVFNNISKGDVQKRTIQVMNNGKTVANITITGLPNFIMAKTNPIRLLPGHVDSIEYVFDSKSVEKWGDVSYPADLVVNGKNVPNGKITFTANIVEDFSKMTLKEKRNAPIVEIKSELISFGKIKSGKRVRGNIKIKNIGKNNLEVRNIVNNNKEIHIVPTRVSVKNGKATKLKVEVDTKGLAKGEYSRKFTVQTNDPMRPYIVYTLSWVVE